MVSWARLCWSLAALGGFCAGMNIFTLEVIEGDSQSLILSINPSRQKLVKKYDPKTEEWKNQILAVSGNFYPLKDKTASISLVYQNFTVWYAKGTEEGLYRIIQHIDNRCLAVVNVTVLDLPLPETITSSFNASSKVTETVKAPSSGTDYAPVYVTVPIAVFIAVVFIVQKLIKKKSKRRTNNSTSAVDFERAMNHEQQEIAVVW